MIELILGTYGVLCWLLFKKRIVPTNAYTVCSAFLGGLILAGGILVLLATFHPATKDGRLYAYTTPIIPQVKGRVIETLTEGQAVKKGDVLFKIDPQPYQYDVDRVEASLANAKSQAAQLQEELKAAEAGTSQAMSQLRTAESDFNRQAQEDVQRAESLVRTAKSQYDLAKIQYDRQSDLLSKKVIPQAEFDVTKSSFDVSASTVKEAEAALRQAQEKLKSGSDRVHTALQQLRIAEAQERNIRLGAEAEIGGVNPLVSQLTADLADKRWNLEQTVVRAPADGFITQVILRPGQMAVPFPVSPSMVFVQGDKMPLMASLPQNVIKYIEPGLEVELAFKALPGRIYKGKVGKMLPLTEEGQLTPSGKLRSLVTASVPSRIPFNIEYGKDVEDLQLPGGSQAIVAVYTHHLHALSIIRKILVRIKSWENYLFMP